MARTKINTKRLQTYIGAKFRQGGTFESISQDLITLGMTPKQSETEMKKFQRGGFSRKNNLFEISLPGGRIPSVPYYPSASDLADIFSSEDTYNEDAYNEVARLEREKINNLPEYSYEQMKAILKYKETISDGFNGEIAGRNKLENFPKVNKNSTPQKVGKTVSQVWIEKTGMPWAEAKKMGLTDGSKAKNIALLKRLKAGEDFQKREKQTAITATPAGYMEPTQYQTGYYGNTDNGATFEQFARGDAERVYQRGGEIDQQQIQEEVISALQNGAQPQDIVERLIQMGVPADEAQMFVQEMLQQVQQAQASQGGNFQEGGESQGQVMQAVAQALQEGADPEEVVQFLVREAGMQEDQAIQVVQQVMQSVQGQGEEQFQSGGEAQDDLIQGIAQALSNSEDPEELVQYLSATKGIPVEQAQQMVQQVMQMMQEGDQQYQEGGEQGQDQVIQAVAQALQQGQTPEEIVQLLVDQAGIPEEQAVQIVQQVVQMMQGQQ